MLRGQIHVVVHCLDEVLEDVEAAVDARQVEGSEALLNKKKQFIS